MKKALSLFLTMVMLLGLAVPFGAVSASAATPSSDYASILESIYDEETKTYTMTTADHLLALAYGIKNHGANGSYYYYGKTFVLGADITLNTGVQDAVAAGNTSSLVQWPDLSNNKYFHGSIDGKGHTISGIYSPTTAGNNAGIFGYTQGSENHVVTIENLAIVDSYISSTKNVTGGLFGATNMITTNPDKGLFLKNLYLDIDVTNTYAGASDGRTTSTVGGVIGNPRSSMVHIDSVVSVGTVSVNNTRYVGGFLGAAQGGDGFDITIANSAFYGSVVGASMEYGMFVGRVYPTATDGKSNNLTIVNCVAAGTATTTSTNKYHGAFVGYSSLGVLPTVTLNNNLYTNYRSDTSNTHTGAAGFVPNTTGTKNVTVANLTGAAGRTTLANSGFESWLAADGDKVMPAGAFEVCYKPATDYAKIISALLDGSTYTVSTKNQLLAVAYSIYNLNDFSKKTISIGADITVNEGVQAAVAAGKTSSLTAWPSMGQRSVSGANKHTYFRGNLHGNGHTISGLYMVSTALNSGGLFGYASNPTDTATAVKDLSIVDSHVKATQDTFGGLFGQVNTSTGLTLSNLYLDIDVSNTTNSYTGTVIGSVRSCKFTMDSVVSVGNISGKASVGGLIGRLTGKAMDVQITNCASYGTVTATSTASGVLVGDLNASDINNVVSISNCVAGGTLTNGATSTSAGALIGQIVPTKTPTCTLTSNLYVDYATGSHNIYTVSTGSYTPTVSNNMNVSADDITGKNASALLTEKGFTAWTAQVEGKVIPTTVRDFWFPTTNTKFVGYQISEAEGARFSIRLIGVVDALDYDAVGFKISLTCADAEIGTKNRTQTITKVYNTLTAVTPGGSVKYTANELGGNYIFALNINNVPAGCGNVDFLVRTFHKDGETVNYDGRTAAFTLNTSFSDLTETPVSGTPSTDTTLGGATATTPETTDYTDIGYEGLDLSVTTNARLSDYQAKIAALEAAGYKKVSERVTAYNYFAQMDNETETLWVSYYGTKKQLRISTEGTLVNLPQKEAVANPVAATVTQYANYASQMEDQSVPPGMGYIIKADNGKLIVIDGAHNEDVNGFYAEMQKVYGSEHPVIAAWIFTHAHDDHVEGAIGILEKYGDAMTVEAVYSNFLSKAYNDKDTADAADIEADLAALFTQIDRLNIPTVTVRTGMEFYVGGLKTSFLFAADDMIYAGAPSFSSMNDLSLIFKMEYAGETILFLGDALEKAETVCSSNWSASEWKSNACQVAHHGINGVSSNLDKKIAPEVLLWTCNMVRYNYNYSRFEHTIYLHSLDVENIIAYDGTRTLTFGQFVS